MIGRQSRMTMMRPPTRAASKSPWMLRQVISPVSPLPAAGL